MEASEEEMPEVKEILEEEMSWEDVTLEKKILRAKEEAEAREQWPHVERVSDAWTSLLNKK